MTEIKIASKQQPALNIDEQRAKEYIELLDQTSPQGAGYNLALLGGMGTGKTSMLRTARMPCLLHSFDPGGSRSRLIKDKIDSGEIVVDSSFEQDDMNEPTAFARWEQLMLSLRNTDFFSKFRTFCLDSFTTWIQSMVYQVAKMNGKKYACLKIPDWQIVKNVAIYYIRMMANLPCDFILTGHLTMTKDEASGGMVIRFNSIPSLQIPLPMLFDEIYVMEVSESPNGIERYVITQNTGMYEARTRIGGGIFELREKPDIMYLLGKAGLL